MDKQPSFTERIARLKTCAHELHKLVQDGPFDLQVIERAAETMLIEAQHMQAAAKRFETRRPFRGARTTTRASR